MTELKLILAEVAAVLDRVSPEAVQGFTDDLRAAGRVFVLGEGRSGLMGKAFAMRLMHLGARVYAVGETITPAVEAGDTLVVISGSGTTASVLLVAERVREIGGRVLALTTNPESPLARVASRVLHVPAATKYRREGEAPSIQPLGSLFDQCAHVVFDAVCLRYAGTGASAPGDAFARHSNLE
jgi:6-phospho-3-hexuloisomerase